jgi:hypothetical protein
VGGTAAAARPPGTLARRQGAWPLRNDSDAAEHGRNSHIDKTASTQQPMLLHSRTAAAAQAADETAVLPVIPDIVAPLDSTGGALCSLSSRSGLLR